MVKIAYVNPIPTLIRPEKYAEKVDVEPGQVIEVSQEQAELYCKGGHGFEYVRADGSFGTPESDEGQEISTLTKAECKKYLDDRGVEYSKAATVKELQELVQETAENELHESEEGENEGTETADGPEKTE